MLCGLDCKDYPALSTDEEDMQELCALLETAGGECVGKLIQPRQSPDPKTLIGSGKAIELRELCENEEADLVVFDTELSPSQASALSEAVGVRVIDRSALILDIFASRAKTAEGRLQVELAQYKYMLPRLSGMGLALSRLGGGIGTRGPGETKLETDRRHIRARISKLEEELSEVRKNRGVQRRLREKSGIPVCALVGYTNAGKSTLLNLLTGAGVEANDRLFDTLDPTTRRLKLSDTQEVLLTDTVGFIKKLPTRLIEAFKATLEELSYADVILHVIDASNPLWERQASVVDRLLTELGADKTPTVLVFNKLDVTLFEPPRNGGSSACISAKTGGGVDDLREEIEAALGRTAGILRLKIPYSDASLVDMLHTHARVDSENYTQEGVEMVVFCPQRLLPEVARFCVREET